VHREIRKFRADRGTLRFVERLRGVMRILRLSLALGFLLTAAACASQSSGAGGNSGTSANGDGAANSGAATSSSILPKPTGGPPIQANQAAVDARAVNLRPVKWTRAEAGPGHQLLVHYTVTGRADCSLLGRVDTAETADAVTVTVFLGHAPGTDCSGVQPMLAAEFVTTVTLREPLGARTVKDGAS
jgi:hypothetical protein